MYHHADEWKLIVEEESREKAQKLKRQRSSSVPPGYGQSHTKQPRIAESLAKAKEEKKGPKYYPRSHPRQVKIFLMVIIAQRFLNTNVRSVIALLMCPWWDFNSKCIQKRDWDQHRHLSFLIGICIIGDISANGIRKVCFGPFMFFTMFSFFCVTLIAMWCGTISVCIFAYP